MATNSPRHRRRAFTLVELLVVVGIIVVLLAILLPMLTSVRKKATRTRIAMDLQNLSQCLEHYRQDFKDYPPVDMSATNPILLHGPADRIGAVTLCWALLAPGPATTTATLGGDGADGPGFRVRGTQGQTYGPYIQTEKYNITGTSDWDSTINDVRGNPYLYFRANPVASINAAGAYVGDTKLTPTPVPMYDHAENTMANSTHVFQPQDMQKILGDANLDGGINTGESAATTAPYILWSAGSDEIWGYDSSGNTDDVTNFNN
jgi:prepilin-type N-terminal cleavage/methylation domain-containing protein